MVPVEASAFVNHLSAGLASGAAAAVGWRWIVVRGWVRRPLQRVLSALPGHAHAE